jgi:hypothetical protein
MAAELGAVLASHLRHPDFTRKNLTGPDELAPLRQIWVPNPTHIEMLHHFGYAYPWRQKDRPYADELRLLGRTSLFLFLESEQPGQQLVMSASDAMRSAYDFPAEDYRQGHLGFLLAWLSARGNDANGLDAALEAEKLPVATALLPDDERDEINPRVEAYNEARRSENRKQMDSARRAIGELLRPELDRRLDLLAQAIDVIETDPRPVNAGVDMLVAETLKAHWYGYVNGEARAIASGRDPWVPSPETDFQARGAADRYFRTQASEDRVFTALVHGDRELEAEAIGEGLAFRGTITTVWDEGSTRKTIPVWLVEDPTPGPLSLRRGDQVCVVGDRKRSGPIRSVESTKGGGIALEIEITTQKTAKRNGPPPPWPHSMAAADERWVGRVVSLIGTSFADMAEQKAFRVREQAGAPGDWIMTDRSARRADRLAAAVEAPDE